MINPRGHCRRPFDQRRQGNFEGVLFQFDVESLSEALAKGSCANWAHTETGASVLHYTVGCESGMAGAQSGLVRLLVTAGAVVSTATLDGESVLERALLFGPEPPIALLLESGADPNSLAATGVSMLALARIVGNETAERALRRDGAELFDSDLETIEQWDRIADFGRRLDRWMDRNPAADGEEYLEAQVRILRHCFGDQPELVDALDRIERTSTTFKNEGYGICGGGWAGVACRKMYPPR